jgi:hypothetical protein
MNVTRVKIQMLDYTDIPLSLSPNELVLHVDRVLWAFLKKLNMQKRSMGGQHLPTTTLMGSGPPIFFIHNL